MTIIDAIKSKKKIKRDFWPDYMHQFDVITNLTDLDILADDWEIEPVMMTRGKFEAAFQKCLTGISPTDVSRLRESLIRELGL